MDSYDEKGITEIDHNGWQRRKDAYESFSRNYGMVRKELRRGEIYEFDWGVNVNCEFSKRHYGVVLVDSPAYNPLVTVCPLKTNIRGAHPNSDINIGYIDQIDTQFETLAVVNQIRALDKMRIYRRQNIKNKITNEPQSNENMRLTNSQMEKLLIAILNYYSHNGSLK